MTEEQAVASKPEDQATPETEGAGAQDKAGDIDELLKTFDASEEPEKKPEPSKPEQGGLDTDKVAEKVLEQVRAQQAFDKDMSAAVEAIRGEVDSKIADDDFVTSWLDSKAKNDPRLAQAWKERHQKPREYRQVLAKLGESFQGAFSAIPNKEVTEDRAAVAAAVRGASTSPPKPEEKSLAEVRQMSEVEKEAYRREISRQYAKR